MCQSTDGTTFHCSFGRRVQSCVAVFSTVPTVSNPLSTMFLFGVVSTLMLGVVTGEKKFATFYGDRNSPQVSDALPSSSDSLWTGQAEYSPAEDHVSNFAQLAVESNKLQSDDDQMFAAGYLEAYLTAESIFNHNSNMLCQVLPEKNSPCFGVV